MDKKRLRDRAERLLNKSHQEFAMDDQRELEEILHELNVHQIELELQNDELRKTVHDLELMKRQAEQSRNAFAQFYNYTPIGFIVINEKGLICHCNATALSWFNVPERKLMNKPLANYIHPEDRPVWWVRFKGFMQQPENKKIELRICPAEKQTFYVEISGKELNQWFNNEFLKKQQDRSHYFLLSLNYIDDRKKAEEKLLLSASVFDYSPEAIMITDANNRIIQVNPAFTRITGYDFEEVFGLDPKLLSSGKHDYRFYREMWDSLLNQGRWQGEIWNKRKNGEKYPEWLTLRALKDSTGKVFRFIGIFSDITKEKNTQKLLNYQATHDQLTGLPNRILFYDRLEQSLRVARRNQLLVALFFIDLDGFKNVNDTLGHSVGDELLIEVAKRINVLFRSSDTFARLGGDEFVVILNDLHSASEAVPIAEKILYELSLPFSSSKGKLTISGSLGIAIFPKDSGEMETLIQYADNAMYAAKKSGRNQFHFFKKEMQQEAERKFSLEKDLKIALSDDQLEVFFQPIIDLAAGRIVGAESLARWRHPQRGLLLPDQFIPLAEECGLIGQIGVEVTKKACAAAENWKQLTDQPLYLTINLSVQQFRIDPECRKILSVIKASNFPLERIVIEITESVMISYHDCLQTLNNIRKQGIKIFLDDFGTGYSSLSYLKKLPIDRVKIDHSFVKDIMYDQQDASLVEAIISMSHKLGLETIAEGIETAEEVDYLLGQGCRFGQGFFIGRPVPASRFLEVIRQSMANLA